VVYRYNFPTASNVIVSAGANDISDSPTISADGRFIAYRSAANNLVSGDSNGVPDIFLYDHLSGSTVLLTASPYGNWPANGRSLNPAFSGDGLTLIWQSWANNLMGRDFNQGCDIFAWRFSTNSTGPQSSFGISEFGFVPLDGFGSTIQVPALAWTAQPGLNYSVQFKNALGDPIWQYLAGGVRLIGNQGFIVDTMPASLQRFYRVLSY
jgi:hypothetical protein